MLPQNNPDRIRIIFDDHRLVANAGLLLPATLAQHLGLAELVRQCLDLGNAPGRANTGDKIMTLVASALAGGDCIDDADALRTGGTACTLGSTVKAPSTLGTFPAQLPVGPRPSIRPGEPRVAGPCLGRRGGTRRCPFTIDLDSTICETYGLDKEGARHHGYTGKRGYHPLLAVAAGTGEVLMSRLREGRANTARGAAHFLRETVGRVRYAGASGRSRCPTAASTLMAWYRLPQDGCPLLHHHPAQKPAPSHRGPRRTGRPFPTGWTALPMWPRPPTLPLRVKPTPGSQLALFARYSYHGFITDRDGETLELEADIAATLEIENAIRDLKYGVGLNHLPSGRFAANAAWLAVQVMAHNLARWTAHIGLGEQVVTTKTLRRRFFALAGRLTRKARRLTLHLPQRWQNRFNSALARLRALPLPS